MSKLPLVAFYCFAGGLVFSGESNASKYTFERELILAGLYDDNQRLRNNQLPNSSLSGASVGAKLGLSRSSGRHSEFLNLNVDEKHYDDTSYNRTSLGGSVVAQRVFERDNFIFSASADRNSVRDFELSESGIGAVEDFRSRRAASQSVGLRWARQIDELSRVDVSASFSHQDFDSEQFRGYRLPSGSVAYQRTLTQRFVAQVNVAYSELESDDTVQRVPNPTISTLRALTGLEVGGNCSLSNSAQQFNFFGIDRDCNKLQTGENSQKTLTTTIGFIFLPTKRLTIDLSIGQSRVETDRQNFVDELPEAIARDPVADVDFSSSDNSLSYSFSGDYTYRRGSLNLSAKTDESANSNGLLRRNVTVKFEGDYRFTERLTGSLFADYFEQKPISSQDSIFADRQNTGGGVKFYYRLTKALSLSLSQRHITQKRRVLDSATSKNITNLGFSWKPVDYIF